MGIDTSGNIRPIPDGEGLRPGETSIDAQEARVLRLLPEALRRPVLDAMRNTAQTADDDPALDKVRAEIGATLAKWRAKKARRAAKRSH